jgi:tRNA1(Val) A37 N6-methylase TrmN6
MPAVVASGGSATKRSEVTFDAFLGGHVEAVQPAAGHHRAGLEAVLLAASVPENARGLIVDLGAGAGVAGLCIARRCPDVSVTLVERDRFAAECARKALGRPANAAFAGRVEIVETDIATREGLADGIASAAIFNPPFYAKQAASASPALSRAEAHILGDGGLDPWFRAAAALVRPGGTATIIFRADGLDLVLAAAKGRFGALDILPIAPRPGAVAHRILVRGVKGSRAPLRILAPLVLHPSDGNRFRPEIDGILRGGADIAGAAPTWNERRDHSF